MTLSMAEIIAKKMHFFPATWKTKANLLGVVKQTTETFDQNSDDFLVITQLVGNAWLAGTFANSLTGTPLMRFPDPSPPAGTGNQLPSLSLLSVRLNLTNGKYIGEDPQNWMNVLGTVERPHVLTSALVLPPKSATNWDITPNLPAGCPVAAEICGLGYYVPVSDIDAHMAQFYGARSK